MATTTTITKMLFRRGNDSDRQQTILASGEPGWCLDTNRLWIGDGVTPGGYPALSAVETHLQYEPIGQSAPQALNINIPGLDRTLTNQHGNGMTSTQLYDQSGKYVYPANQSMLTYHDIQFMEPGNMKLHTTLQNETLKIDCAIGGEIDIGDGALIVSKDSAGNKSVKLDLEQLTFTATRQVFDQGTDTHFEDKSIDLNVVYIDPDATELVPEDGGAGSSSNNAGIFISHDNYLSAGYMKIGDGLNEQEHCSVWELAPPVYRNNWEAGLPSTEIAPFRKERGYVEYKPNTDERHMSYTDDSGASTSSSSGPWIGSHVVRDYNGTASNERAPKHIRIMSPRPNNDDSAGYEGYSHLILESGLISYGPGDPRTHGPTGYNAYLLNQSVDTASHPTFSGLTIRAGGDPIPVTSGGTGVTELLSKGVVTTPDGSDTGPLTVTTLDANEIVVGTTAGVRKTKFSNGTYVSVVNEPATGKITFNNDFAPGRFRSADVPLYINKWYNMSGNAGSMNPTKSTENLTIKGILNDDNIQYIHTAATPATNGDGVIRIKHLSSTATDTLFDKSKEDGGDYIYADTFTNLIDASEDDSTTDTVTPTGMQDTGLVIGAVKINSMGHLENIRSKDLDTRYAKHLNMGTKSRKTTRVSAPADETVATNTDAVTIPARKTRTHFSDPMIPTGTGFVKPIVGTQFNDYGTINSVSTVNLSDYYLDKSQTYEMIKALASGLNDAIAERKSNDADIADIYAKFTRGADKIHVANQTVGANDAFRPLVFANETSAFTGGYTSLGCDATAPNGGRLLYRPSDGMLHGVGQIHATSFHGNGTSTAAGGDFHGDGAGLFNLSDVVSQSQGGTFDGPITVAAGSNGYQSMSTSSDFNQMVFQGKHGGYADFRNSGGLYDGRFMFTQSTGGGDGKMAFRFHVAASNTDSRFYLGGMNEMLRITQDYTGIAHALGVGGTVDVMSYGSNQTEEGGQINVHDAGSIERGTSKKVGGVNATCAWSIDNYKDTAANGGYYKLGTNSHLLRFFRTGGGWVVMSNAGDVKAKGDIIAYGTSDKRLKKKLKPIDDPLEKISMIGGYTFEWDKKKTSARSGKDVGVVAQEIEKILPEIVETRDDEMKTKAVRYDKIIPLLIEGIKELTQKVESLEAQLEAK